MSETALREALEHHDLRRWMRVTKIGDGTFDYLRCYCGEKIYEDSNEAMFGHIAKALLASPEAVQGKAEQPQPAETPQWDARAEAGRLHAVYQTAYANAHCKSGKGVIESDEIALRCVAKELEKIYAAGAATAKPITQVTREFVEQWFRNHDCLHSLKDVHIRNTLCPICVEQLLADRLNSQVGRGGAGEK